MESQTSKYYKQAEVQNSFWGLKFKNPFPLFKKRKVEVLEAAKFLYGNYKSQLDPQQLKEILPARIISPDKLINKEGVLRAVWIGHATVLIQDGPINILTDPIFNARIPQTFYGYKRLTPLPITINDLPKIHAVILSHDHRDHCNMDTLKELYDKFNCHFFVGKQSSDLFPKKARENVHQMNWTQKIQFSAENRKYRVHFVPACHWSGRGIIDHFKRLWGGFVIETPENKKVFYAGDTGYCEIFKQIGDYFGSIDLSLIPIGAYMPRQFLCFQHIDPEQAVVVHKDIKCKQSLAIHWATYQLACQAALQPREDLQKAMQKHLLKQQQFIAFFPSNILTVGIPVLRPVFQYRHPNQITWFGHSTLLFQISGLNILINPVFSKDLENRVRYTEFPGKVQDLPKIDIILINQPIDEKDLLQQRLSDCLVMTNKQIKKMNTLEKKEWQKEDVRIQLRQSLGSSSFFIRHRGEVYQICENHQEQNQGQKLQVKFLYLPIRPFSNDSVFNLKMFRQKYKVINPEVLIPINWGSFEYKSENIVHPLNDIKKQFKDQIISQKVRIPVIGKTIPLK